VVVGRGMEVIGDEKWRLEKNQILFASRLLAAFAHTNQQQTLVQCALPLSLFLTPLLAKTGWINPAESKKCRRLLFARVKVNVSNGNLCWVISSRKRILILNFFNLQKLIKKNEHFSSLAFLLQHQKIGGLHAPTFFCAQIRNSSIQRRSPFILEILASLFVRFIPSELIYVTKVNKKFMRLYVMEYIYFLLKPIPFHFSFLLLEILRMNRS
jgi:hypothetical protein